MNWPVESMKTSWLWMESLEQSASGASATLVLSTILTVRGLADKARRAT